MSLNQLSGLPVALFPALNAARFGGAPQTLGLLTAALAAGGVLGSALSGPAGRVSRQGRAMLVTVTVWGATIAGFGLAGVLGLDLLLLAWPAPPTPPASSSTAPSSKWSPRMNCAAG